MSATAGTDAPAPPPPRGGDPVRRVVLGLVGLAVAIFAYSLVADRFTPATANAHVGAFLVRVAPEVPGRIVEVPIIDNQYVEPGTLLFRIDPRPFEIAVSRAEAGLAAAGQMVGANTAALRTAEARVASAMANADNIREQAGRVLELVRRSVYPRARGDQAEAALRDAEAQLAAAIAEQERARETLGPAGEANPQLRQAADTLREAELNLLRTRVLAPAAGLVTNLQLTPGQFVAPGQGVLTFIDLRAVWVLAELRENALGHVRPRTRAEIVFDALPGRVFPAHVSSISWGIGGTLQTDPGTGLPVPRPGEALVRFPLLLVLDTAQVPDNLRFGSQATVMFYTGRSSITDAIGRLAIRAVSVLTYVY